VAIAKEVWDAIKADYEAGIFKEETVFSDLAKKYKVDRGGISKKAKAKDWEYGKFSHLSQLEASSVRGLSEVCEKKSHLNHTEVVAIENKTKQLLERDHINANTMILANAIQDRLLQSIETMVISDLRPKEITGAMKDINDMANPKESNVINNANAQQNNTEEKRVLIARRSDRS
jgi:hypothetical protein